MNNPPHWAHRIINAVVNKVCGKRNIFYNSAYLTPNTPPTTGMRKYFLKIRSPPKKRFSINLKDLYKFFCTASSYPFLSKRHEDKNDHTPVYSTIHEQAGRRQRPSSTSISTAAQTMPDHISFRQIIRPPTWFSPVVGLM